MLFMEEEYRHYDIPLLCYDGHLRILFCLEKALIGLGFQKRCKVIEL